jgi:hypothetical protein
VDPIVVSVGIIGRPVVQSSLAGPPVKDIRFQFLRIWFSYNIFMVSFVFCRKLIIDISVGMDSFWKKTMLTVQSF